MYILTKKVLFKREDKAWKKGNNDATKAWQMEFELQNKLNKENKNRMLDMLEKIILEDTEKITMKMKKADLLKYYEEKQNELLNTIKLLKED